MDQTTLPGPGKAAGEGNAMVRGEDGEFELILGNRQLLSVFFIVVALLGVFFTMGYIVGKNAGSSDMVAKRDPLVVDPSNPRKDEPVGGTLIDPRKEEVEKPPVVVESAKPVEPVPEPKREVPPPEPPKKEAKAEPKAEPKKAEAKKAEPKPVEPEPPARTKPAAIASNGEPAPGQTFLQVVASTRPDCEMIVGVLKRKGLPALVAPGPNDAVFRVLVGPLPDAGAIAKARTEVEAVGFLKPIVKKY